VPDRPGPPAGPEATPPPLVSALVTARDDEDVLAATLDSVLGQEYPPGALEAIVVDDGSIDRTGEVADDYAAHHPGRVRVIRQAPAGPVAALARALAEARGDVLAPIRAGDAWPQGRIALQVATLQELPAIGLVYSELDAAGGGEPDPPVGRPVARLLREDCIGPSSIALRGSLRDQLGPIPPGILRADRWLLARAATVSEIVWAPAPGTAAPAPAPASGDDGPPSPSAAAPARAQALRESLVLQRWFLRNATSEPPLSEELGRIWSTFTSTARALLAAGGGEPFTELVCVTDAERDEARRLLAQGHEAYRRGETLSATVLAARAAALDPWCAPARALLVQTLTNRPRRARADPLAGARRFVTLAFADELLEDTELLAAYAQTFDGEADATLAIDASALTPAGAADALSGLVERVGLDRDGTAHLIAVLGPIDAAVRERLPAQADALLTRLPRSPQATPRFDDRSIGGLRELSRRAPSTAA
jgi:glycosyl transferase family 2